NVKAAKNKNVKAANNAKGSCDGAKVVVQEKGGTSPGRYEPNVVLTLTEYTTIEALDEALLASQRVLTRLLSHFSLIWRTPSFEALPRTSLVRQIARLGSCESREIRAQLLDLAIDHSILDQYPMDVLQCYCVSQGIAPELGWGATKAEVILAILHHNHNHN
ncbi:uncharacterized protein ACA1_031020, partial [Acanthamoeba castellanii str. Neff]